jgi:hypothetical protein
MKQVVVFENEGVIDVRSMKMFGVSVKEGTNPIGYFGTGLKYAIAILLRHGQKVTVFANDEMFQFGLKPTVIRGKAFEVVTMNDEEMPFTTELGKNWELWQAFRELYCNCLDESGFVQLEEYDYKTFGSSSKGKTRVIISGGESVNVYHDRDSIVLKSSPHLRIGDGNVVVYDRPSDYVYYRNVRVWKLKKPSMFTYNIVQESELTEDRTLKNFALAITKMTGAVCELQNRDALKRFLLDRSHYECEFDFAGVEFWGYTPSREFEEVVELYYELNTDRMNPSARAWYKNKKNKESLKSYQPEQMNAVQQKQMNRCLDICKTVIRDFENYDIMVVKTLGEATMAIAEVDQQRIIISKRAFEQGTKYLLSTIIEEIMHIKTGFGDCTREFQTAIFDSMCSLIEDHVIKEPV